MFNAMKSSLKELVAKTITKLRKTTTISQEELAYRSGLDRTYISGIERGVRNITLESLEKVVSGLDIDMETFLEEVSSELRLSCKK